MQAATNAKAATAPTHLAIRLSLACARHAPHRAATTTSLGGSTRAALRRMGCGTNAAHAPLDTPPWSAPPVACMRAGGAVQSVKSPRTGCMCMHLGPCMVILRPRADMPLHRRRIMRANDVADGVPTRMWAHIVALVCHGMHEVTLTPHSNNHAPTTRSSLCTGHAGLRSAAVIQARQCFHGINRDTLTTYTARCHEPPAACTHCMPPSDNGDPWDSDPWVHIDASHTPAPAGKKKPCGIQEKNQLEP